jgi:HEAT repeat protein
MLQRMSLILIVLAPIAYGQQEQTRSSEIAAEISHLQRGEFSLATIEDLAQANVSEAIPALKEQFARSRDTDTKAKIADALLRLGEKDSTYWDFLEKTATQALESDVPMPTIDDSEGNNIRSPEFEAWVKSHHTSEAAAGEMAAYGLPAKIAFVAETGDPRALPLLRQAMLSPNYFIEAMAAKGLAKLQNKDSIPLIIGACERATPSMAIAIATALVFFDDVDAQNAADTDLPKDYVKALRELKLKPGHDVFQ